MESGQADLAKVVAGLNLMTMAQSKPIAEALLRDNPKTVFREKLNALPQELHDAALANTIDTDMQAANNAAPHAN